MTIRKIDPQPSAPVARPSTPVTPKPKPAQPPIDHAKINAKTGRTSSFEAYKPPPVALDRRDADATSEGRGHGTNDDSIGTEGQVTHERGTSDESIGHGHGTDSTGRGHGTNDDSIGRGTNDDSIGRGRGTNDDSIGRGRGTNDDSIGGAPPTGRGTNDEGIGGADEPTARGPALIPGREGLKPETTVAMDRILASEDADKAAQAAFVFSQPAFQAMPADQRAKLVAVMDVGGVRVARATAEMFEQSDGAMLNATGKDGTTVLDSLARMSASPNAEGVVGDVMYDLVNPGRIWQGRAPTCTVSTMQYELALENPGEYARLMTGLVTDGKVTMAGGGELATDVTWAQYASTAKKDGRSGSEAIFQAAAMEFANGSDTYLEYSQQSIGGKENYQGLHADQISSMLGQLFGVKYETKEIGTDAEATAELNEIVSRERPNRPVLFSITIDGSDSNHCVSLESVRNGRVYFRDPTTGERESMTIQDFRTHLASVQYAVEPKSGFLGSLGAALGSAAGAVSSAFKNLIF